MQMQSQMTLDSGIDTGEYRKENLVRTLRDWREGTEFSPKGRIINWIRLVSTVLDRTINEWEPPSGEGPYRYNELATDIEENMRRITAGHGGPHLFTLYGFEPGQKNNQESVSFDMTFKIAQILPGRGVHGQLPGEGRRAFAASQVRGGGGNSQEEMLRMDFLGHAVAAEQWAVDGMVQATLGYAQSLRRDLDDVRSELFQTKSLLNAANDKIRQMQDTEHSRKLQIMKTITWQESIQSLVDVVRGVLPLVAAKLMGNDSAAPGAEMDMLVTALGPLFEEFDARHGDAQVKEKMEHVKQAVGMKNMPAFIMLLKMYADRKNAQDKKRQEAEAKIKKGIDGVTAIDKATTAELVQKGVDAFIHPEPQPTPIPIIK